MTESKAIKRLQTLNIILTDKAGHEEDGIEKIFTFSDITAICTAIQALEEVEQYRAIGTLEEVKALKDDFWKLNEMCRHYSAIGTLEEVKAIKQWKSDIIESFIKYDVNSIDELMKRFRELTEKAEPKKPIGIRITHKGRVGNCPCCNKLVSEHNDNKICSCNQRLAWG